LSCNQLINVLLKCIAQITFANAGSSRQLPDTLGKLRSLVPEGHHLHVFGVDVTFFCCSRLVDKVGGQCPGLFSLGLQQLPRLMNDASGSIVMKWVGVNAK
jgi:hypothetical protein